MSVLRMPQILQYPWIRRRTLIILTLVIGLPLVLIGIARIFATDLPKSDRLGVAQAVLEEYVRRNPPNKEWVMTATRITDDLKLEMDVDVANYDQAQVIFSRTGRIRHSYMKLACPELESDVYSHLPERETIWVNLHYNGEPIVRGACPLGKGLF